MTQLKTIIAVTLAVLLSSCNTKIKEEKTAEIPVEEHQHASTETIELNNGAKWKVDATLMLHIRNMEKDIADFEKNSTNDYALLATKLKQNVGLLTSNCTMEGQAHDELHKWLVPYIELVEEFSKEKSAEKFTEIQHSFITLNQYFQ